MLPLIQQLVVSKGWLNEEEAVDCIAVSQALPGILSINAATYIGKTLCGLTGALAATLGCILPSFIIIITVVTLLGTVSGSKIVEGAFLGIKAAVCGLVVVSAVRLGKTVIKDPMSWILTIMAFVMIAFFDITALWAIIAGGVIGVVYQVFWKSRRKDS